MQPTAMSEKYEWCRNFSRANVFDRCSSMNGSFTPSSASRMRDAGVGEAARIDDGEGDAIGLGGLDAVDELVLGVALEGHQLMAQLRWPRSSRALRWRPGCPTHRPRAHAAPAGSGWAR